MKTVVTYYSDEDMDAKHSFVATNNRMAAQRLAHELGVLLDGEGEVSIIAHVEGAFTTFERAQGFKQGIKPYENIKVFETVHYTDNSHEIAYETAQKLIKENPNINALFGTNEVTLLGIAEAIRDMGLQGQVKVVGFDMSDKIALYIEEGIIDATMVQKPFNMGYIAVKEALEVIDGKEPETIDTGAVLINQENMFLPENQKLIVPNVD